jgi:hypothetical protein
MGSTGFLWSTEVKWPLVSRAVYDLVIEERDRLRAQNDEWLDHARRVSRRENGMTELPPQPRKPREPIPSSLTYIIDKYDSEHIRQNLRNSARIAHHREGKAWSEIAAELETSIG